MTLNFLNDVVMTLNQQKNENYVIIASLKSETMGKLINRIPGSRLLISSLLGKPRVSTRVLKTLPGKLDIKRHSPSILYILGMGFKIQLQHNTSTINCLFKI